MQQMVPQLCGWTIEVNVFMHQPVFKQACPAAEEPQLGIGIEAAVANPAAEEEVLARDPKARDRRIRGRASRISSASAGSTSSSASSESTQSQLAFSSAKFFWAAKPSHGSTKNLAWKDSAISRVRSVEPESTIDDLVGPGDALQRACEVGLLVQRDDDDG